VLRCKLHAVGFCLLLACLMSLEAFRRLAPAKQSRVVIGTPFAVARILLAVVRLSGARATVFAWDPTPAPDVWL
jgi:hypothetical protein